MQFNNIFTIVFLAFLFLSISVRIILDIINYNHRKKYNDVIPKELKGLIDKKKLVKINNYTNDKLIFTLVEYFVEKVLLLLILFSALIPIYYNYLITVTYNYYFIILLFFGTYYFFQKLVDVPFSIFFNFKIEKKYQFNKMTFTIWISDFIKEILISASIFSILLVVLVFLISTFSQIWWILLWVFIFLFSITMQIIYPTIIAPLFNKFIPLKDKKLKIKIEKLLKQSGFKSNGVYQMDASKRSSHSNAYFTGIGKSKRIVLFDSLLEKHSEKEILSILAHEIGHFKYKHILKGFILSTAFSFIALLLGYFLINNYNLYEAFGFQSGLEINKLKFIGLFLLVIISSPIFFFFSPLQAMFSRMNEFQADKFAANIMKTSKYLISSLKKLNIDNLSNIYPADIYSWFYYSHPPLFKRIRALQKYAK